ncbi:hypothetical protein JQX13_51075 [Archangium violaceum]|uniref:hypothetical protein n=1 Tax=Archangium violaceum TaxID=83451 RepID=UPI00193B0105|nr:hypothetical protein [Archangium violaceum]QRK08194.1 hypothetical protein JQX13_51075 [Archangium violaceum]
MTHDPAFSIRAAHEGQRRSMLLLALVTLTLLPACGDDPPSSPSDPADSGTPAEEPFVELCTRPGEILRPDAGSTPDAGSAPDAGCQPLTCEQLEANCGEPSNGCGGTLSCGTCTAPEVCGGRGRANTCAIPAAERWCNEDGWCWEAPLPHGYALNGAHFRATNDGWAVGKGGHIQHWDGTKWSRVSSGTTSDLNDVHAVSATDVWTVGSSGTVLRFSGAAFSPVSSGTTQNLSALWASGSNDVWTVGNSGTVLRNQGSGFKPVTSSTTQKLNDVWGSGPNDVWVVGNGGTLRHYDGTTFAAIDAGTTLPLYEVTGAGPNDVWAVTSEDPCFFCNDYGIVYRVTPGGLSESLRIDDQLFHVHSVDSSALFTVGESLRYQWNGTGWKKVGSGRDGALAGSSSNDMWLLGEEGHVERWNGSAWTRQAPARALGDSLQDVHGISATNLWAVGSRLMHWNGGGWYQLPSYGSSSASGLYAASANAVWIVTSGSDTSSNRIYRWNGTGYTEELSSHPQGLLAVHGSSETDVWAVGRAGLALHNTGSGWACQPTGVGKALNDVWVQGPSLAIAVGDSGTIVRWDGNAWSRMSSGTGADLHGVWGSGPSDIWAVGANGTLLHHDGNAWSSSTSGTTTNLTALWGTSSSSVWATGENGTLLRYDGSRWTSEHTGTGRALRGLWAASTSDVWLVGDSAILHKP